MDILLFGGSFDPVHNGHINILRETLKARSFDKVIVMPTGTPGHKASCKAPFEVRRHWAQLAFSPLGDDIEVSDYENRQEGKSYSYLTVNHLKEEYPDSRIFFLIGEDSAKTMPTWRNWETLARNTAFLVLARDNDGDEDLRRAVDAIREISPDTRYIKAPVFEVSSTQIRRMARAGIDLSGLVPEKVNEEIRSFDIYSDNTYKKNVGTAKLLISLLLREKRAKHTYNVAGFARQLAERFGVDADKAYLAGLLHDIMKQVDEETLVRRAVNSEGEKARTKPLPVLHGFARADYIKKEMGIEDEDIINAIRSHTCGRAGMSDLEKVIYLADMLSPERQYPEKEYLTEIALKDLDLAMEAALRESILWVKTKGGVLDEDSQEAYEYFKKLNERR